MAETGARPNAGGFPALPAPAQPALSVEEPIRVGLLVPLSGRFEAVGRGLLDAGQMAVFESGDARYTLLPRDTRGDAQAAADAVRELVDRGVSLLLGPLFSGPLKAVRPIAEGNGLRIVGFSTDSRLEAPGVFIFGFDPEDEVRRIVSYAAAQGKTRFAALLPAGAYGEIVKGAVRDAVGESLATLRRTVTYHPDPFDIEAAVRNVVGLSLEQVKARRERGRPVAGELDFDTLLLVATGDALSLIVKEARAFGLTDSGVQLLGTAKWQSLPAEARDGLVGAWYAAPSVRSRAAFEQRFAALYGRNPPDLASLAYDAVKLSAELAERVPNGAERTYWFDDIETAEGAGVNGAVRFRPSGRVDRSLAVYEIGSVSDLERDPAPTTSGARLY